MALGVILAGALIVALVFAAKAQAGSSGSSTSTPATTGTGSLPPNTSSLTPKQQQFAARLQADTGLDPSVIAGWLLAEESGSAAQSRDSANNNDWLNIGYTDSGTFSATDSIWNSPTTAADATAAWMQGQNSIPGYGTASSGIRSILASVGQSVSAQISAIQNSGWASSGYPDLISLVAQVSG